MLRWVALKRRIDNSDSGNAMLGAISPSPQQPGGTVTITPGPGMGSGGFGSSGGGQTVVVGSVGAVIVVWTPSLITITVPAQSTYPILLPVVVTTHLGETAGGLSLLTVLPVITALNHSTGQPGASLTITGTNFGAGTGLVSVAGHAATVTSWTPTAVTVTVPTSLTYPSAGVVTLTTLLLHTATGPTYTITVPSPVITHAQQPLSTNVSTAAAGSTLDIIGTHFGALQGTGTLKIHGHSAVVSLWSDTRVTVTVPSETSYPDVSGIILTTGGALVSNPFAFTTTTPLPILTSVNHSTGQPGDSLILTGTHFGVATGTVDVAGHAASVTAWADTSVTVTVPSAGSGSGSYPDAGSVTLTTAGALVSNGIAYTITVPDPTLTSLSAGAGQPGDSLTLTGTFLGASAGSVTVDSVGATVTAWADTSVTVTVPAQGAYPAAGSVILTTAGALVSNGLAYTTTLPSPVITSLSELHGHPGDSLVLTGTDFGASQGGGGVTMHGTPVTVTAWADLSVTVTVPSRGSYPDTGNVVLTTGGALTSNSLSFLTLAPYALKAAGFAAASSEYLYAPSSGTLDLPGSSFTLAFWFNPTDRSTWGVALAKAAFTGLTDSYYVALNYGGTPGDIGFFVANGASFYQPANLNFTAPQVGTWCLWVGVVDLAGPTISHRLNNGSALSAACPAGGCNSTLADFFLGTYGLTHTAPGGNYLNAALDSVGVWGRALSGAEQTALYNSGVGLAYQDLAYANGGSLLTGLNAWWDLDELSTANKADSSGNGNTLLRSTPAPAQVTGIR